jgi:O-antigen ligase
LIINRLYNKPSLSAPDVFLRSPFYFAVTLSVLATTVFSFFRVNSYCIILFVACGLWHYKPGPMVKAVFSNKLFLAYFIFFLIGAAGLLYTHNLKTGMNAMVKDATLVAIACVLCTGSFAGPREYRRLMAAYCGILFLACLYCLVVAARNYRIEHDTAVFFYHPLTSIISQNAVFFSVYVLLGMLSLLSSGADVIFSKAPARVRWLRIAGVAFFMGMIILLSSKLFLVVAVCMLAGYLFRKFSFRRKSWYPVALGAGLLLLTGGLFLTANPVRTRYLELAEGNMTMIEKKTFDPGMYFNAIQLRVLEWRFAGEILNEHHAWVFGVSPGDSQDLLDRKYIDAHMYIGNPADGPHRKIRGFIGYNFHNQYLETLVRSGLVGLLCLLTIIVLLIRLIPTYRTREVFFTVLTMILFFIPEAPLTMQQGIFLFCFFPLVLPYGEKTRNCTPEKNN